MTGQLEVRLKAALLETVPLETVPLERELLILCVQEEYSQVLQE